MKAEIIKNPWYPSNISEDKLTDPTVEILPITPFGDDETPYVDDKSKVNRNDGHGFLSLRQDKLPVITDKMAQGKDFAYTLDAANFNEKYYIEKGLAAREYFFDGTPDASNIKKEAYSYQKDGEKYTFNIPLFTRAKVLVKQTGYSGNNPFVGYQRVARIKLTATLRQVDDSGEDVKDKDGNFIEKPDDKNVNVVQVRRVVNPKGVYRSAGRYEPFNVKMMWLNGDNSDSFTPVVSHGPWKADIIGDANFITLNGKKTVSGSTNTNIDFTIRFNHLSTGNKNAVVRIKYHNYTCTHLIFVRQGYEAQALTEQKDAIDFDNKEGGATPVMWETCNMISRNVQASDPRDEGSMFKFGTSASPIDAINNVYQDAQGNILYRNLTLEEFNAYKEKNIGPFKLADEVLVDGKYVSILKEGTTAWTDFKKSKEGFTSGSMKFAATMRHFEQLYLSNNVHFGYGVLYADGAYNTQSDISQAYGYYRGDATEEGSPKGMRGMFAYYWDGVETGGSSCNGRNIFFPIGRSGYGHRKNKEADKDNKGYLRYSASRYRPAYEDDSSAAKLFPQVAPLFVSIFRRPGAIYWARHIATAKQSLQWNGTLETGIAYGLDINYFSFDVNSITEGNVGYGEDACFVRCVKEPTSNK